MSASTVSQYLYDCDFPNIGFPKFLHILFRSLLLTFSRDYLIVSVLANYYLHCNSFWFINFANFVFFLQQILIIII